MRKSAIIAILVASLFAVTLTAIAQTGEGFELSWFVVAGGGGSSVGGEFQLDGTAGQAVAVQELSGGPFGLSGGFMAGTGPASAAGVCGDLDRSGSVNILDITINLQISVGLTDPTAEQLRLGDLDGSGDIDVGDAIKGLQHIVGIVPNLAGCGSSS